MDCFRKAVLSARLSLRGERAFLFCDSLVCVFIVLNTKDTMGTKVYELPTQKGFPTHTG